MCGLDSSGSGLEPIVGFCERVMKFELKIEVLRGVMPWVTLSTGE